MTQQQQHVETINLYQYHLIPSMNSICPSSQPHTHHVSAAQSQLFLEQSNNFIRAPKKIKIAQPRPQCLQLPAPPLFFASREVLSSNWVRNVASRLFVGACVFILHSLHYHCSRDVSSIKTKRSGRNQAIGPSVH